MPAWGTTLFKKSSKFFPWFQSTCPRGARRIAPVLLAHSEIRFNPRARVGHDVRPFEWRNWCIMFQSTCPRGARQSEVYRYFSRKIVSIHVPAWGTTKANIREWRHIFVSIHVPAWGTTTISGQPGFPLLFQSTCPRGARPLMIGLLEDLHGFQSTCPRGARLLFCNNLLCNTKESCNR